MNLLSLILEPDALWESHDHRLPPVNGTRRIRLETASQSKLDDAHFAPTRGEWFQERIQRMGKG